MFPRVGRCALIAFLLTVLAAIVVTIFLSKGFIQESLSPGSPLSNSFSTANGIQRMVGGKLPPVSAPEVERDERRYLLFIMIMTTVDRKKRDTLRETWLSDVRNQSSKIQAKFFIGTWGLREDQLRQLKEEECEHHDIIFLPDLKEDYFGLTKKLLQCLLWVSKNVNAKYLLKCDDDIYVIVGKFLEELEARKSDTALYWGQFYYNNPTSKFIPKFNQEHNWFLCQTFLPYALGGAYVLSMDVVQAVAFNADMLQLYVYEDTALAVWISSFQIERKDDRRFNILRGCHLGQILFHCRNCSGHRMRSLHRRVLLKGSVC